MNPTKTRAGMNDVMGRMAELLRGHESAAENARELLTDGAERFEVEESLRDLIADIREGAAALELEAAGIDTQSIEGG